MARDRAIYSAAALILWLYVYYTGQAKLLPAFLIPVAIHEMGHLLAIRSLGLRVERIRLELCGLCISYRGECPWWGHVMAAGSGPAAGVVYALLCRFTQYEADWLTLSAQISLTLSAFNLLPVLPLDGGRIFCLLCEHCLHPQIAGKLIDAVSACVITLMLGAGVYFVCACHSTAPLAVGLWLLLLQNRSMPLVKDREIS